jgi:PDZ domain-containing protein
MVVTPGKVVPLLERLTIDGLSVNPPPGAGPNEARGEVLMLTIEARPANVIRWLASSLGLSPGTIIYPRRAIIPAEMSPQEYQEYSEAQMRENAGIATVLASQAAGEEASMQGAGALIVAFPDETETAGLDRDDRIVGVGGRPVSFTGDLASLLRGKQPGAFIDMTLERRGRIINQRVRLRAGAAGAEETMLGALTLTSEPVFSTSRRIVVDTAGIGGPSGGLAMALAIHEGLAGEGLLAGKTVAATGYIRPDGTVGPVGGVRLKAIAAVRAGADVMFVAPANAREARAGAGTMAVVEVSTFEEALVFLRTARLTPR